MHILACYERGTVSLTSKSRTFTIGGFAAEETSRPLLTQKWKEIKQQLCGKDEVELKWSPFFPGFHQKSQPTPLISPDPQEWRKQALWALEEIFKVTSVFPITAIVHKSRAGESLLAETSSGRKILDVNLIIAGVLGQFALYLKEKNADVGEIWFDNLGSEKEEKRIKDQFQEFFESIETSLIPTENRIMVQKIRPYLIFKDSAKEPLIQLADFISGVIWAASEGDEWFIYQLMHRYAPGRRRTYGILNLEA